MKLNKSYYISFNTKHNNEETMKLLSILFIILSINLFAQTTELKLGDKVKNFEAKDDNAKLWKSEDLINKKYIAIYFYPAAMTSGCTAQACAFRDDSEELNALDIEVVGISGDEVESLKYFKKEHNLNFTLLSDNKGEIAKIFGVPLRDGGVIEKEINGEKVQLKRGVTTARWTFILDKEGKLIYKNDQVKAADDSKQVIDFIKNIK